jgi:serine/threonine-protein kinase
MGPLIVSVVPNPAYEGDPITVTGIGFGATQGTSQLLYDGAQLSIASWSDTQIQALLPDPKAAGTYNVQVVVGVSASNIVQNTIGSPLHMAYIPAGCFNMGDAFSEGLANERPVHNVCISAFEMDKWEVTNAKYKQCVDAGVCTAPAYSTSWTRSSYYGNPTYSNYPVIFVNWNQASTYCTWAGKRLPTEAEWEYAARGGLAGKRYPWGDDAPTCSIENFSSCVGDTNAVGSYPANGYGLYDMEGNVGEWVNDWFSATYYQYCVEYGIVNDPPGPMIGTFRDFRGGYWGFASWFQRVAYRTYNNPSGPFMYLGIRCAQ